MNTITEKYFKIDNNNDYIQFVLEVKNQLQTEQQYFRYLHESYDNLSIPMYMNENMKFLQDYKDKMLPVYDKINEIYISHYIDTLNNILLELCEHEYVSDHIETGVESNMMKITYCIHCKMNKP